MRHALDANGEAGFENLGIGGAGVGHVYLHAGRAVEARARAGAAGDGLVILEALIAPDEVVHRPLASRDDVERAVKRLGDGLADLGVPGDHGGGVFGVDHGPLGQDQAQRFQAAFVQGDVAADQRAEDI
jgi:hypothetical protein